MTSRVTAQPPNDDPPELRPKPPVETQWAPVRPDRHSESGMRLPRASRHSRLEQPDVVTTVDARATIIVAGTATDFFTESGPYPKMRRWT